MAFDELPRKLLANTVRMLPVMQLYPEIQQGRVKICIDRELPVQEISEYIYNDLKSRHTMQISAAVVTIAGANYLYGVEREGVRYVWLFNAQLKDTERIYSDACSHRIGGIARKTSPQADEYTITYNLGSGRYRDFRCEHEKSLQQGEECLAPSFYTDDTVVRISENRIFEYAEGRFTS